MTTIDQVILAENALNSAMEEYVSAVAAAKPRNYKGLSFAMEEAIGDTQEEAKKTMWERFKAFVKRIVDWLLARFKKVGEKKATEAEKFEEELEAGRARWDQAMQNVQKEMQKMQEEFTERAKAADANLKSAEQRMREESDPEWKKKAREQVRQQDPEAIYNKVFASLAPKIHESAIKLFNEKLEKYTCLGSLLDDATLSNSSFANINKLDLIDGAFREVNDITTTLKSLTTTLRSDFSNTEKIKTLLDALKGQKLSQLSDTFKAREGKHLKVTDVLTVSSINKMVDGIEAQLRSYRDMGVNNDLRQAISDMDRAVQDNKPTGDVSKTITELQHGLTSQLAIVSGDFFSLNVVLTALRQELVSMQLCAGWVAGELHEQFKDQFIMLVKKENSSVLDGAATMQLRFMLMTMLGK